MAENLRFDIIARDKASKVMRGVSNETKRLASGLKDVGKSSGDSGGLSKLTSGLSKAGSVAAGAAKKIALVAIATMALSGGIQVVGALAGVLGGLAGVAAVVPAVLGAIGVAAIGLKLGLTGVADAWDAMASGDAEAMAEAMKKLAPSAQSFMKAVQGLKPAFDSVRMDVQQRMFEGLGERMTDFGTRYMPVFQNAMRDVSTALNENFHDAFAFFDDNEVQGQISNFMNNTTAGLFNIRGALPAVLSGFLDLGEVGSRFLPAMGEALRSVAVRFGDFMREAASDGRLEAWINTGIDLLAALGDMLGNIGGIAAGVFRAMGLSADGASGSLGGIGQILRDIHEWVDSFEGQQALSSFFESTARIAAALFPILEIVAEVIGTVLAPALADLAEQMAPGLIIMFEAFGEALRIIAESGALGLIGQALSDLMIAIAPLLPALAVLVAELLSELARIVIELAPQLPELVEAFGNLALAVADNLPAIADILIQLGTFTTSTLPGVINAVATLIGWLGDFLEMLGFTGESAESAQGPMDGLSSKFIWMLGPVGWLIDVLMRLGRAFGFLPGDSSKAAGGVTSPWDGMNNIFAGIGRNIMSGLSSGLQAAGREALRQMESIARGIVTVARGIFAINSPSKVFRSIGHSIGEGLEMGINDDAFRPIDAAKHMAEAVIGVSQTVVPTATVTNQTLASISTGPTADSMAASVAAAFARTLPDVLTAMRFEIDPSGAARLVRTGERTLGVR